MIFLFLKLYILETIHYCIVKKNKNKRGGEFLRHTEEMNVQSYENIFAFQKEYYVRFSSYWGYS